MEVRTQMQNQRLVSALAGALLLYSVVPVKSQSHLAEKKARLELRLQLGRPVIEKLLAHPSVVKLDWNDKFQWRTDEYGSIALPPESLVHPQGIFRASAEAIVWPLDPVEVAVYGGTGFRVLTPGVTSASREEAEAIALDFLKTAYPAFFEQGPLPKPRVISPWVREGEWEFEWQRYREDELPDTLIRARVRTVDGKITSFSSSKFAGEWKHNLSPTQAAQIAIADAAKDANLKDFKMTGFVVGGGDGRRFYDMGIEATIKVSGAKVVASYRVDAESGYIYPSQHAIWTSAVSDVKTEIKFHPFADRSPIWTKQGLVFSSNRQLSRMPNWADFQSQIFVRDAEGKVAYCTADLHHQGYLRSGVSTGESVAITHGSNWAYVLDLLTGRYRIVCAPQRDSRQIAVSPNGLWAMLTGMGQSDRDGDVDLLPDNLSRTNVMPGARGRLRIPTSFEEFPVYSPDGKYVYFLSISAAKPNDETNEDYLIAVCQFPMAFTQNTGLRLFDNELKTSLKTMFKFTMSQYNEIKRLSISELGQQLVMQTDEGIAFLSLADKRVTPIVLKNLKDAEVGAAITETRDGWAGPGEGEVTFSGKTTDKEGKVRWRIYSCKFNGSGLKAWTPKENQPVEAYKFPDAPDGKTAIDLAKEWALQEIKFEDEMKRRGG